MVILPPYHTTIRRGAATMALLRDALYRHLCPPGAHSDAVNSLYASQATPCALGFAKIEGEMVILPPYHPTIRPLNYNPPGRSSG